MTLTRRSRRRVAAFALAASVPFALVTAGNAAAAAPSSSQAPPQAVLLSTKPVITSTPPVAVILLGQYFTHTYVATGDPKPTWSIAGSLPPGLTFNTATGVLSGVPTFLISANTFTVTATNSAGSTSQTALIATALSLGGSGGSGGTTTNVAPQITSQPPVAAVIGQPYAHQFSATGTPTPTWSYTGTLPPGLTLNATTGLLSGTPTGISVNLFTVIATNSAGSAQQPVALVFVNTSSAPVITSGNTLAGTVGTPFAFQAVATGVPVPTWSVEGNLPAGVTLDTTTGIITGTPTTAGTLTFTLVATNSAGSTRQNATFVVAAAGALPVLDASTTIVGTAGKALNVSLTATGNPTWSLASGTFPAGLSVNLETGVISGTPSTPGTTTVQMAAKNLAGIADTTIKFVIYPPQLAVTPDPGTGRYAGDDRITTAIDVSQALFPTTASANAVVLTTSEKYADALAGGRLASANGGPLLLNPQASLQGNVAAEISRVLKPGGTVYVLGGEDTLSPQVAASVSALSGGYTVQRLAGANRFETAVAIADEVNTTTGGTASAAAGPIYLVNGQNFPDGLAVSALAARTNGLVLLTDNSDLPASTSAYLAAHDPTGADTIPVGGQASLAASDLPTVAARAATAQALVGADRYDTARLVAAQFSEGSVKAPVIAVGLATGENWPDALVGAAAMGALNSPLLLTPKVSLDTATQSAMASLNGVSPVSAGLVFGGLPSISAETEASFAALVPGDTTQAP